ncbi:MAG: 6-carboxytetrahydropterin synthase QueD [Kiritimatiellae bacterium]|nr:6-carboxytetrahydropterin synthase QueD [Kiritimatiellia bacterium]MBR4476529.1 6-carboxytetrahydropterin synthase QueD [Kiritimatiellia bacterium]
MTTVTKSVKFDAAHILTNHQGLCKNLHGHTYRVDVSVTQPDDDPRDMVIDFKDLKSVATSVICDRFDHAFIYSTASEGEREIASVVEKHGMRTVALPFRSTAENLARYFFGELKPRIPGLVSVKVWETADSCAEFCE